MKPHLPHLHKKNKVKKDGESAETNQEPQEQSAERLQSDWAEDIKDHPKFAKFKRGEE